MLLHVEEDWPIEFVALSRQYFLAALIVLSMLLVPLAMAPKVQAVPPNPCQAPATICWGNPSGGSWETVANWILPGGGGPAGRLPTASDDVYLIYPNLAGYTVTISSVQTVHSILVGPSTALTCSSTCTLTIKSHTPAPTLPGIIGGGLVGVAGFTPAAVLLRADIYGVLTIAGNVVNDASLVDGSPNSIHIDAGGTFVNVNSLDFTGVELTNSGVFVEKCGAVVVGGIALVPGTVVTESPCPTQVPTASGSSVSGTASFSSDLGGFTSLTATARVECFACSSCWVNVSSWLILLHNLRPPSRGNCYGNHNVAQRTSSGDFLILEVSWRHVDSASRE